MRMQWFAAVLRKLAIGPRLEAAMARHGQASKRLDEAVKEVLRQ